VGRRFESCRKRLKNLFSINKIFNIKKFANNHQLNFLNSNDNGNIFFYIGLFLLPSALSLGIIFLLISSLVSFTKHSRFIFREHYNLIFSLNSILLIVSGLVNYIDPASIHNAYDQKYLSILGLLNWLPLFFCFITFQNFLKSESDRKKCFLILISGSMPVFFSCLSQTFFKWYGPFETFFGLITWFQRPLEGITGVSGLFSNPNYLSAWLIIILPFVLAIVEFNKEKLFLSLFKKFLIVLISIFLVLTASRAAWILLVISIPIFYGLKLKKWFFFFCGILSFIIINLTIPILGKSFQEFLKSIIPEGLWINFTSSGYETLNISRVGIWAKAIEYIQEKPLLGHGSRAFSRLLSIDMEIWKGHSHNLPLELMVSYGIPAALFILIPIILLVFHSYRKVFIFDEKIKKFNIIDRAWITSSILLILMHMVDIQYFDARISIVGWILISGLKNITISKKYINNSRNNIITPKKIQ